MQVKVKKLHPDAVIPKYAKLGDAGLDLTAISKKYDSETNRYVYDTGLAFEIPDGHVGLIFPRSSICKKGLSLSNSVGIIDSKYRGSIKFFFAETYFKPLVESSYNVGDRIGQIIIMPYPQIELVESEVLSETERGDGGFGSSGR